MSNGEPLSIEPLELKFPFELKKNISCSLQLSNKTDSYVSFKVKTTNPNKYRVRPNPGIVLPRSTCDVIVTMLAQKESPPDMQCRDQFLFQIVRTFDGASAKDINAEMVLTSYWIGLALGNLLLDLGSRTDGSVLSSGLAACGILRDHESDSKIALDLCHRDLLSFHSASPLVAAGHT
ncbi:hypothetical protein PIB30_017947 [Stylosanthes scabra]|uniref:MSP domain-containing protein n=1 Tax=Stylosanthes scabra TaxID=79078 RepID=A0ABU6S858_9FABA|nr:hypothetical protein [Stylosanthes scabra]